MKKGLTELIFIIDCSGSMYGLEKDTIGGFNSMIEKNRKGDGKALVSTVFFSDKTEVIHDRASIEKIKALTEEDYQTGGCTALLDVVGGAIHHIAATHRSLARHGDQPEHTMFVIITDGMENASRVYSYPVVRKMIDEEKKKYGWEFLFLGANIDAEAAAQKFGISRNRAVNYNNDCKGIKVNYEAVGSAVFSMCSTGILDDSWRDEIDEDYKKRPGKNI